MMHTHGCTYSDGLVIIVELIRQSLHLSTLEALPHPLVPLWIRRLGLPSVSQFNRRVKTPGVQQGLSRFNQSVRAKLAHGGEKICDGKPLIVGGFSTDPDARTRRLGQGLQTPRHRRPRRGWPSISADATEWSGSSSG
ncbi:MAG: hypothetical protein K8S99_01340 [Planctomycetes bacterium]|nr:hypothetical protein [Planctomycetota bacterium]